MFTLLVCVKNTALGVDVPLNAKVVIPPGLVEADHWFCASYCTVSWGVEVEVMVTEPPVIVPGALKLPLLSTRNREAPAALV